ncbi:MAG: hypothetical protein MI976_21460 [Pseudomonadales bacterium]|nr:hypothetical protein [Pseudomonadales bacterium]
MKYIPGLFLLAVVPGVVPSVVRNVARVVLAATFVLLVGCRPTIEFSTTQANVVEGSEVNLSWDVELAKGSGSARITLSPDVGEVELEGSTAVVVDETTDFEIRVSTFVLGMPITAKESVTVTVLEDNYQSWTFNDGVVDGWEKDYVFYHEDDADVLCESSLDGGTVFPDLRGYASFGESIALCVDNENNESAPDEEERSTYAYIYRKFTKSDGYELEAERFYRIRFEVGYGIRFDPDSCDDLTGAPSSNFSMVFGASAKKPRIDNRNDLYSLYLYEFDEFEGYEDGVKYSEFNGLLSKDYVAKSEGIYAFNNEEYDVDVESWCRNGNSYSAVQSLNSSELELIQESNNDAELWIMVGFLTNFDGDSIEYFIDNVNVLIEEVEE